MVEPTIEALIIAAARSSETAHTGADLLSAPASDTDQSTFAAAKLNDALVPGFEPEFTPHEAEAAGAFLEDALREEDAREADPASPRFEPGVLPPNV